MIFQVVPLMSRECTYTLRSNTKNKKKGEKKEKAL